MNGQLTIEQKMWLVRRVPDEIEVITTPLINSPSIIAGYAHTIQWKGSHRLVTDHEWPFIVSLVEGQLKGHDRTSYTMRLREIVVRDCEPEMIDPDSGLQVDLYFYCATPSQRTTALMQVFGKETTI